ncbi:hypothetical protein LTR53_019697, partial [Teratosphaeriaceae sp. CCFEE 6253]
RRRLGAGHHLLRPGHGRAGSGVAGEILRLPVAAPHRPRYPRHQRRDLPADARGAGGAAQDRAGGRGAGVPAHGWRGCV